MPAVPMNEFKTALASLRKARNFFMLIILIVLIFQIGVFFAVDKTDILSNAPAVQEVPTSQPACGTKECKIPGEAWRKMFNWTLPASRYAAFFAAIMLTVTLGVGAHFSMLGPNSRGIHQMISAFLWSMVLVLLLAPWQKIMPAAGIASATFSLGDIFVMQQKVSPQKLGYLTYYARFVAYPAIAVLVWCMVAAKFGKSCRKLTAQQADVKVASLDSQD